MRPALPPPKGDFSEKSMCFWLSSRTIHHCEYFHLAKGRDLGFNTVLGFFSKLASGTGEQVITRQAFRLGQVLQLPEALTFYYAHVGYYFTQFFVSMSMP